MDLLGLTFGLTTWKIVQWQKMQMGKGSSEKHLIINIHLELWWASNLQEAIAGEFLTMGWLSQSFLPQHRVCLTQTGLTHREREANWRLDFVWVNRPGFFSFAQGQIQTSFFEIAVNVLQLGKKWVLELEFKSLSHSFLVVWCQESYLNSLWLSFLTWPEKQAIFSSILI